MNVRVPVMTAELEREVCAAEVVPHCFDASDPLYANVIALAATAYRRPADRVAAVEDKHSDIYALERGGKLVGTITVTQARRGLIESQEQLPTGLLSAFGDRACYAYRLAVDASAAPGERLGRLLMRLSYSDGLAHGMRLALASVRPEMAEYYRRVGYVSLTGSEFCQPRFGTPHRFVACPADPQRSSLFTDLCRHLTDPLPLAALTPFLASQEPLRRSARG